MSSIGAWAPAVLPALVFVVLLLLPGFLVLAALGARLLRSLIFAPVVSAALAGLFGVVLQKIGVAWGVGSFAAATLVLVVIIAGVRSAITRTSPWSPMLRGIPGAVWRPLIPIVVVGAVIGALAASLQLLHPVGAADHITFTYDAVWHYDVIRHILLTGDASSLDTGLLDGTAGSHYYPAAWHSLVALTMLATGATLPVAVNASLFVLFAFVWPFSAGVLAVRLFGRSRLVLFGTMMAAPLFAAFPSYFLVFGPLYSNLFSFAIAPLSIALFVELLQRDRWRVERWKVGLAPAVALVFATFIGMVFAQPNSLFTLFVVLLPLAYLLIYRLASERLPQRRWVPWSILAGVTVVWVTGWVLLHNSAPLARTVNVDWPATITAAQAFGEFVLQGTEYAAPQIAVALLVALGVLAAVRADATRWIVASYAILGFLYVLDAGTTGGPHSFRDYATGFWYHDHVRLAAAIVLLAAPLAGAGFASLVRLLDARFGHRLTRRRARPAAMVAIIAVFLVAGFTDHALAERRGSLQSAATIDRYQMLNPDKVAFLREVKALLPAGVRVANDPNDGSGFAYSLYAIPVVFSSLPGNWIGSVTHDQAVVLSSLNTLAADPSVCAVVRREKIGYVIALAAPQTASTPRVQLGYSPEMWRGVRVSELTPGFERILGRGDMSLYRITGCS